MNSFIKYFFFALLAFGIQYKGIAQRGEGFNRPFQENRPFRNNGPFAERRQFRENRPAFNKLNAIRNAYINKQLNLSPEEAERFWPIYNQYQAELNEIYVQKRINNSNPQVNSVEQLNRDMYYDQRVLTIKQHYKDQFLRILPPGKVNILYQSERDFRGELMQQLRERNNQGNR